MTAEAVSAGMDDGELREFARSRRQDMLTAAAGKLDSNQGGRVIVKSISKAVDDLVRDLWCAVAGDRADEVDLVAVGGYGRAELCPHSDWDLNFLVKERHDAQIGAMIQRFAQVIWDSGAHLGHAVRTPDETRRFAETDHHARTALLESRLVSGSGQGFARLQKSSAPQNWTRRQRIEFCRTKLEECGNRRQAQGDTAFCMEPDCKNGKGALRDVSTIFWLSMAWYGVPAARELIGKGVVDEAEFSAFTRARDFLWRVRTGLHLQAKRENDRLRFDYQNALARRFNYRDTDKSSAVERFLKNYFLKVRAIADLSDIFLLHFEEQIQPPPRLRRRVDLGGGLEVRREEVGIRDVAAFAADPLNLIRIFVEAQKNKRYLNSRSLRVVRNYAHLMTASVRQSKAASTLFLELLRSPRNVTTALSGLHETGVLGRFCPDFGRITGFGQFDRYHHYTVDAHTIRAIDVLRDFRVRETKFINFPLAADLMRDLERPELLYLALLYHDIAKGRGGDHSEIGEDLAARFCRRLGLSVDDVRLVCWLVRHHLRLSKVAQHYDISDPGVVAEFARFVGDRERLVLLFLLTIADVTAVGPGTWTDWKGYLFNQLYSATDDCLRTGRVHAEDQSERIAARRQGVLGLAETGERKSLEKIFDICSNSLVLHFPPAQLVSLCRLLTAPSGAQVVTEQRAGAHSRVFAWGSDRPRLFAHLTAALAAANTKVMTAYAYTLRDGRVLDEFHVTDASDLPLRESGQIERLVKRLEKVLAGEAPPAMKKLQTPDILMQAIPVHVRLHAAAAHDVTAVEVVAADRKGLLASLAEAIADTGIDLRGANVSTFGEKAVDVFFVTDEHGRKLDTARVDELIEALREAAILQPEAAAA